jgi:hypothetical protein
MLKLVALRLETVQHANVAASMTGGIATVLLVLFHFRPSRVGLLILCLNTLPSSRPRGRSPGESRLEIVAVLSR